MPGFSGFRPFLHFKNCTLMKRYLTVGAFLVMTTLNLVAQGQLQPPGGPAPSMVSLDQIAKRVDALAIGTRITNSPVTISAPGYYYLTNHWSFTTAWGISITTNNVVLDLNGFTITGNTEGGGAIGGYSGTTNIVIRNGFISGVKGTAIQLNATVGAIVENMVLNDNFGGITVGTDSQVRNCLVQGSTKTAGITTSHRCAVTDCRVYNCKTAGIYINDNCTVYNSTTISNGAYGICGQNGDVIRSCLSVNNKNAGILVQLTSRIESCQSIGNSGDGITGGNFSTLTDCTAAGNTNYGVYLGNHGTLRQCTSLQNRNSGFYTLENSVLMNCTSQTNKGYGFWINTNSRVLDCAAMGNYLSGIYVQDSSEVRGCSTIGNLSYGIVASDENSLINNTSSANGTTNTVADGLQLNGTRNIAEGNRLIRNSGYGIRVLGASNIIIRNTASGNKYGSVTTVPDNDVAPWSTAVNMAHPAGNITIP